MKKLDFAFSDPTKQAILDSLAVCVENIEKLTVQIDDMRSQLPRGTRTYSEDAARAYSELLEMQIQLRCVAATGFTLFGLLAVPLDCGPFGVSFENEPLVQAFEDAGFSGVDSLDQYVTGPTAYRAFFQSVTI